MKNVINSPYYSDGELAAEATIKFISTTVYRTLEGAIAAKQELIDQFESESNFAYSREIEDTDAFDRNYAFNCGMLDRLKRELDGTEES